MKRLPLLCIALTMGVACIFAQQITRVGVIDMQKIYFTYYKDSQAVRSFEDEKQRVQEEILRPQNEIKELQSRPVELQRAQYAEGIKLIDDTLRKKAQYLQDFIRVKQSELDDKAAALMQTDSFAQLLYRTVQTTAELEGYSVVLSARDANSVGMSIVWFSPMVDITDKVIQAIVGTPRP